MKRTKEQRRAFYIKRRRIENKSPIYFKMRKARINQYAKKYSRKNRHKIAKRQRKYYLDHIGKEELERRQIIKQIKSLNRKLANNLRIRILHALKGKDKSMATLKLLGCSIEQFKKHLQSLFKLGMTLENHGEWHIDHIRPCSSFDLSDPKQQSVCFHYTNLQPLWARENLKKHAKITKEY